jgi:hypothetical protein
MEAHSVPYEGVQQNFQTAVDAHKAEETPFFAASIERKARSKRKANSSS